MKHVVSSLKIAKFEFKVTVQYGLWQNASGCDPVSCVAINKILARNYWGT